MCFRAELAIWQPGMPALANTDRAPVPGPSTWRTVGPESPSLPGALMRRDPDEPVAELQWLEDGIGILVNHTVLYTKVIVLSLVRLYRQLRR